MTKRLFFTIVLAAALAGCATHGGGGSSSGGGTSGGPTNGGGSSGGSGTTLTGTTWKLERIHGRDSVGHKASLIVTAQGRISGNLSCNAMFGHATIDGHKITFGGIGSTMMACTGDGVMAQEHDYADALKQVAHWRIDDGDLYLSDRANVDVLVFED